MDLGLLLWFAPDTAFRCATRRRTQSRFADESSQIWHATRTWRLRLVPGRPRYGFSVNLMMRYKEWSCALYRALQEHGPSRSEAGELVEAVMLDLYRPVPNAMFRVSRFRGAEKEVRVRWILSVFTRYFFDSPFRYRHHLSETGVAFDVTRCPLADYFEARGVPELTEHAACKLDYCAAREFGVELVRSQTIADGAEYCDFRWEFPDRGERVGQAGQP